jgi:hypothetical protein
MISVFKSVHIKISRLRIASPPPPLPPRRCLPRPRSPPTARAHPRGAAAKIDQVLLAAEEDAATIDELKRAREREAAKVEAAAAREEAARSEAERAAAEAASLAAALER